jgi:hypothetical protein
MRFATVFRAAAVTSALGLTILVVPHGADAKDLRQVIELAARKLLQQPPFPPTDINLFTQQLYPNSKPMVPATSSKFDTDAKLRVLIATTLAKRDGQDHQIVKRGLADFDNPQLKQIIPDARLRAALALLEGTIGGGSIDRLKSGIYSQLSFDDLEIGIIALTIPFGDGTGRIVFNRAFQFEDPRLLAAILCHETLHDLDLGGANNTDELLVNYLHTMVYAQEFLEEPNLAHLGTYLTRFNNTLLMAVINDRDAQGNLRLTTSQGNLFPGGSVAVPNFVALFNPQPGEDLPSNALLDEMVSQVTGMDITRVGFNETTIDLLDRNQNLFSPTEIIAIAVILGLWV